MHESGGGHYNSDGMFSGGGNQHQHQQNYGNFGGGSGGHGHQPQQGYGGSSSYGNYGSNGDYNNGDGPMFTGNGASYAGFGERGQPQQGYGSGGYGGGGGGGGGGSYGNGDYNAWGPQQPPRQKQHYDDYYSRDGGMYGDERGMKMLEQGMGGLGMGSDKEMKDFKEMMSRGGEPKKASSWASIASQPAKPQSISKKSKLGGIPLPPNMMTGGWESKNGVAKAAIAAPVQAPAWERPKIPPPVQQPPMMQQQMPHPPPHPLGNQNNIPPSRGYPQHHERQHQPPPTGYNMPPPQQSQQRERERQPPTSILHNSHSVHSNGNHHAHPPAATAAPVSPPGPKYPDELKMKLDYNPATFDLMAEGARFFVIKSYSEDDIHRSIKYEIWCSTEHGNKRLDEAYKEREGCKGVIYLLFSVNGSGHFCGMAQMISSVDYHAKASVWSQDKWKGQFKVKWIYVKDVPNAALRHIRLENNENKPVTNSRDTQEVPFEKGKQVLKILHSYHHTTSIFDDFIHYEKRQEEEDQRKTVVVQPALPPPMQNMRSGGERGGGRGGGFQDRGGFRGSHQGGQRGDMDGRHNDHNPRDFRDSRGGGGSRDGGGYNNVRNEPPRDRMDFRDRPDREHYSPRDRDDREPRGDRDFRGGHRGGARPMMRNYEK